MTINDPILGWMTIDCMNLHPHSAHTWREGFLWRRKRTCKGKSVFNSVNELPEDFIPPSAALLPMKIIEHKHDFKLAEGFLLGPGHFARKPDSDLLWKCDWLDCNHLFVIDRALWQEQGVPYDAYI